MHTILKSTNRWNSVFFCFFFLDSDYFTKLLFDLLLVMLFANNFRFETRFSMQHTTPVKWMEIM